MYIPIYTHLYPVQVKNKYNMCFLRGRFIAFAMKH